MTTKRTPGRPSNRRIPGDNSCYWLTRLGKFQAAADVGSGRGDRRRITRLGKTKKEALANLERALAQLDQVKPMTVGELAERWWQDQLRVEDGEESTRSLRWERISLHIIGDRRIAAVRLDMLDVETVDEWLDDKMVRGYERNGVRRSYSREYMNKIRHDLMTMMEWAVTRRHATYNPVRGTRLRRATQAETKRTITTDQATALIATCATTSRRYGGYVVLGLLTGMRPGESAGLAWDAVDFDAGIVHVRQAIKRASGGRAIGLGAVKGKRNRSLRVKPIVLELLRREKIKQAEMRLAAGPGWSKAWDGLVFLTPLGEPPWASNIRRSVRQIVAEAGAGIPEDLDPYELRHSCASLLDAAGVAVNQIIDQLGHVDDRMFWKHYRHRPDPVVDNTAGFDRIIGDD
jgi:integrase